VRDPAIVVSSPAGEWLVRPGGRLAPPGTPPAAAPATAKTVHSPWRTPTPRQLADLVRAR
jgi:hypothetical protein